MKVRAERCGKRQKIALILVRADGDAALMYPTITACIPGARALLRGAVEKGHTYEVASNEPPQMVLIHSCPEFDAYLSGNDEWKLKGVIDESARAVLFATALAQIKTTSDNKAATWVELAIRRIRHAIGFRTNPMVASVSSRKRRRGDNEKQKIADLAEEVLTRLFVTKEFLPESLVNAALRSDNKSFLARLVSAKMWELLPRSYSLLSDLLAHLSLVLPFQKHLLC